LNASSAIESQLENARESLRKIAWLKIETSKTHEKAREYQQQMEAAAAHIQGLYRCRNAKKEVRRMIKSAYSKVFDEQTGLYYYFNNKTGLL
jgi:hypothetical protein